MYTNSAGSPARDAEAQAAMQSRGTQPNERTATNNSGAGQGEPKAKAERLVGEYKDRVKQRARARIQERRDNRREERSAAPATSTSQPRGAAPAASVSQPRNAY
jgi:hypothetical protein